MTAKVHEFIVNGEEAIQIAQRLGVVVFDCPCGCGRMKVIEIGSLILGTCCSMLRNYTMEEYCESLNDE